MAHLEFWPGPVGPTASVAGARAGSLAVYYLYILLFSYNLGRLLPGDRSRRLPVNAHCSDSLGGGRASLKAVPQGSEIKMGSKNASRRNYEYASRDVHAMGDGTYGCKLDEGALRRSASCRLASKLSAVEKLTGTATNLLHPAPQCSSSRPECSEMTANSQNTLESKTEEWVSG